MRPSLAWRHYTGGEAAAAAAAVLSVRVQVGVYVRRLAQLIRTSGLARGYYCHDVVVSLSAG